MRVLFLISTKKMCNIVKLKIRRWDELVGDNEGIISIQKCYKNQFKTYLNKKGEGRRVFVKIPDEEGNKELDIYYQDVFPTSEKAIEEGERFLQERLGDVRVSYL